MIKSEPLDQIDQIHKIQNKQLSVEKSLRAMAPKFKPENETFTFLFASQI